MAAKDKQIGGSHYKDQGVQPWDVFDSWPVEQQIGFHRGNAIKYLMRLGSKDAGPQEARKAAHYCEKLAEVLEHRGRKSEPLPGCYGKRTKNPDLDPGWCLGCTVKAECERHD